MAVAFRAISALVTSNAVSGNFNLQPVIPSSVVAGDGLALIAVDWGGTTFTYSTPGGWTSALSDNDGASQNIGVHVYKRSAQAGDASSTVTVAVTNSASYDGFAFIIAYSGADTSSILDVIGGNVKDNAANTNIASLALTTGVAEVLTLFSALMSDGGGGTTIALGTPTSSLGLTITNRLASSRTTDHNNACRCDEATQASSGSTGTFTTTPSGSGTGTAGEDYVVIAWLAAAAAAWTPTRELYPQYQVL